MWLDVKGVELEDKEVGSVAGGKGTVSIFGPGRRVACEILPPLVEDGFMS